MSDKAELKKGFTRRQILRGAPLGIAAAAVVSVVSSRIAPGFGRRRQMPNVPEDSIFAPDRNRYPRS